MKRWGSSCSCRSRKDAIIWECCIINWKRQSVSWFRKCKRSLLKEEWWSNRRWMILRRGDKRRWRGGRGWLRPSRKLLEVMKYWRKSRGRRRRGKERRKEESKSMQKRRKTWIMQGEIEKRKSSGRSKLLGKRWLIDRLRNSAKSKVMRSKGLIIKFKRRNRRPGIGLKSSKGGRRNYRIKLIDLGNCRWIEKHRKRIMRNKKTLNLPIFGEKECQN